MWGPDIYIYWSMPPLLLLWSRWCLLLLVGRRHMLLQRNFVEIVANQWCNLLKTIAEFASHGFLVLVTWEIWHLMRNRWKANSVRLPMHLPVHGPVRKPNFGRPAPSASARWRGDSTPSTRDGLISTPPQTVMIQVVHAHLALVAVPRLVRSYDVAPSTAVDVAARVFLPCFPIHNSRVATSRR